MLSVEDILPAVIEFVSNGPNRNGAEARLNECMGNPSVIFPLVQIAADAELDPARHFALVMARRYFVQVVNVIAEREEENSEQNALEGFPDFSVLKGPVVQIFLKEQNQLVKRAVCELIGEFSAVVFKYDTWPEVGQMAIEMMGNEETVFWGIFLMHAIYDAFCDTIEDPAQKAAIAKGYGETCMRCMVHPDIQIRKEAIDAMDSLVFNLEEDEDILMFPQLPEALREIARNSVYASGDPDEVADVFGALGGILFDRFEQFNSVSPTFCQFALRVAGDQQVPLDLRIKVQQILDTAPMLIPEWFAENLQPTLQAIITLSLQTCAVDRDDTAYQFAGDFLAALAEHIEESDIYGTVVGIVNGLCASGDPVAIQVALFVLECIAEPCADEIMSEPDFAIDLISKGLASPDMYVCASANELLYTIADVASVCLAPCLDDIVAALVKRITDVRFLNTLTIVLEKADHSTGHLGALVPCLIQLATTPECPFKDNAIKCLTMAIKQADVDDNMFMAVVPPLTELLKADISLASSVFFLFGVLVHVSPNAMVSQIGNIMQLMFSVPPEAQLSIVEPLYRFVEKFPTEMAAFAEQTNAVIIGTMGIEFAPYMEEDQKNAICAALCCWAYVNPCCDEFIHHITQKIVWPYVVVQEAACQALRVALPALVAGGMNPAGLLEHVLKELARQTDVSAAAELVNTVTDIISISPVELIEAASSVAAEPTGTSITEIVECVLSGTAPCMSDSSAELKFVPAVYNMIYYWSAILGPKFAPLLGAYQRHFIKHISGKNRISKSMAILALSQIGIAIQSEEVIGLAATNSIQCVNNKNILMRTNLINSLNILIRNLPQIMEPHQAQIKAVVDPILASVCGGTDENYALYESAAALWCTCVSSYGWETNPDVIAAVLARVDVTCDEDLGRTLDFANFCAKLGAVEHEALVQQMKRIAVRTFTLTEWYFTKANPQVLEFLKAVLASTPDPVSLIRELTEYKQRVTQCVLGRLQ